MAKNKGGIYILKKQMSLFALLICSFTLFVICQTKTFAYKRDAKSFVMSMDEYTDWRIENDQTYAQGLMQTVTINIDGEEYTKTFHGDKVKDAIYLFGIDLEDTDEVNLDVEKPLEDGDTIIITSKEGNGEKSFIHFTPLLPDGKKRIIFTNGSPNPQRKVYDFDENTSIDIDFLKNLVEAEGLKDYKRIWVYVGKLGTPLSALTKGFEDVELDSNNKPKKYLKKLDNMKSVAYSANNRRTRVSWDNRTTIPGYVAVDPDKIPYGTKLFIVSEDGSFVYGNAIAADTGKGLKAGTCDFDLIIDSYEESCWFGRKYLEAYIVG